MTSEDRPKNVRIGLPISNTEEGPIMSGFSSSQFDELLKYAAPGCLSLYVPVAGVGAEGQMQPAHLKKVLREALDQINLVSETELERARQIFDEICDDPEFRQQGNQGLAVFIGPDFYKWYYLPLVVSSLAVVEPRFYLKPLLPLVTKQLLFYVLSLSKNEVKFYRGDRSELVEESIENLPENEIAVVGSEAHGRELSLHSSGATGDAGGGTQMVHGGSFTDDQQLYLEKFLEAVNAAVTAHLRHKQSSAPLILTGVERMITEYEKVNDYPQLRVDLSLQGNLKRESLKEIHAQLLPQMTADYYQQLTADAQEQMEHGSDQKFSTNLEEILREVRLGRVKTLLVAAGAMRWGDFDPNTLTTTVMDKANGQNLELFDLAAVETLLQGGEAYLIPAEQMPNQMEVVAVFRY